MRRAFLGAVGASIWVGCVAGPAPALARPFALGSSPVVSVTIPDGWKPHEYDGGVEATAPGAGAYIAVEPSGVQTVDDVVAAASRRFAAFGVTPDPASMRTLTTRLAGKPAQEVTWSGRDRHGPTRIGVTLVRLDERRSVLIFLWGDADELKTASPELEAIAESLSVPPR